MKEISKNCVYPAYLAQISEIFKKIDLIVQKSLLLKAYPLITSVYCKSVKLPSSLHTNLLRNV